MRKLWNQSVGWLRQTRKWAWGLAAAAALAVPAQAQTVQFAVTNVLSVYESNSLGIVIKCEPAAAATVAYTISALTPAALPHVNTAVTPLAGTITFDENALAVLDLATLYNAGIEGTKSILITLHDPAGASLGSNYQCVVEIWDQDTLLKFDQNIYRVPEETNSMVVAVVRAGNTNDTLVVTYSTADGTTTDGVDYTGWPFGTPLVFAPGQLTNLIVIPIIDDCDNEGTETFTNLLMNPMVGYPQNIGQICYATNSATLRITNVVPGVSTNVIVTNVTYAVNFSTVQLIDQDANTVGGMVEFEIDPLVNPDDPTWGPGNPVHETTVSYYHHATGETGPVHVIRVWVNRPCGSSAISVDYRATVVSTCPGLTNAWYNRLDDADPLNDFRLVNRHSDNTLVGTLSWGINDRNPKPINIEIIDDPWVELPESFVLTLFNPQGNPAPTINANKSTFVVTIGFDDQPAGAGDRNFNVADLFVQDPGANSEVLAVAAYGDGAVLGGDFTSYNTDREVRHIARVTPFGQIDPTFNPGSGADAAVNAIAVYSTNSIYAGKILIGGAFTSFDNIARNGIARLNSDGTLDTTFAPGNGVQMDDGVTPAVVRTIKILGDNRILIGGDFDTANSLPRKNIARLNADGTVDPNFDPGDGANGTVWAIVPQEVSVTVGDGRSGSGPAESRTNVNIGANAGVVVLYYKFYDVPDTIRVYYDGVRIFDSGLTNDWNLDDYWFGWHQVLVPFGPGKSNDVTIVVNEGSGDPATVWDYFAIISGGSAAKLIVGGDFTDFGGQSRSRLARLNSNGTVDSSFDVNASVDDRVSALLVQSDKKILVGGSFTKVGTVPQNGITRLNEDGSLDATYNVGTGVDGPIYSMAFDTNGLAYIAGEFTHFNGTARTNVARLYLNGSLDTRFLDNYYNTTMPGPLQNDPIRGLIPGHIRSLAVRPTDGEVFIGGRFDEIGGPYDWLHNGYEDYGYNMIWSEVVFSQYDWAYQHNFTLLIGGQNPPIYIPPDVLWPNRPNWSWPGDNCPGNIDFVKPLYTVDENVNSALVYIDLQRLNGVLGSMTSVVYTVDGSAIAGRDYTPVTQLVAWATCDSSRHLISVPILNNQTMDGNRDFNLAVTVPTGTGLYSTSSPALGFQSIAKVTIVDDDFDYGVIGFSVPYYFVSEDATNAVITLIRTNGAQGSVSVQCTVANGTARSGSDYTTVTKTVVFTAGITNQTFLVPIVNDLAMEPEETILLSLSSPAGGATIGRGTATLVILDNDNGRGSIGFSTNEYPVAESAGNALVTVRRTGGATSTQLVTVVVGEIPGLTNGAAIAGVDFVASTNVLLFTNGELAKVIAIPLNNDTIVEGPELFQVTVFTNAGAYGQLGVLTNAIVRILDDDSYGTLSFLAPRFSVNEREPGALLTVVRRDGSSGVVTVNYATAMPVGPDAAIEAINYIGTTGTLRWEDGEAGPKTFQVPILYNPYLEGNRVLDLLLSNPAKATFGANPKATLLIVDTESQNVPAGSVDTAFNASPGIDNFVQAITVQDDGRLLVGGDFRNVNGVPRSRIARLHVNGELDLTFDPLGGFNDTVYAMAVQPDQKVLVAGRFTTFDVTNRAGIARLTVDGKVDAFFNPGSGAETNKPIFALGVYKDGRIAVGGSFTTFRGISRQNLVVLNTNGTVMTSFNPGMGPNETVYALAFQPDGKLIIAGDFTKYNGQTRNYVARINPDGTLDTSFNPGLGPDDSVRALALQEDGKIVIGGLFATVAGQPRNRVARLNADGTLDQGFMEGWSGGDGAVLALSLQTDGKIVVAGDFKHFNSVNRSRITRLNTDGSSDTTINFGTGADAHIAAVANQTDDQIIIGGGFTTFNGIQRSYLARLIGYKNPGFGKLEFLAPVFYQNENETNALITVRRNWGTSNELQVAYRTVLGGSALPGSDYLPVAGTLTFPQGETLQSFTVPLVNDAEIEDLESINLSLGDPTNVTVGGPAELDFQHDAALTIVSDDSLIAFASDTYSINENAISGFAVISVLRLGTTNGYATADILINGGTASAGIDYSNVVTTISFAPGETNKSYIVPIYDDLLVEGDETAVIRLSNPSSGVTLGMAETTLTIRDNDTAAGLLNFEFAAYTVNEFETNITIRVVRSGGFSGVVEVNYETVDNSAVAGKDYVTRSGSLAFVDGETVKTFDIPILQDFLAETNETVQLRLSNARGTTGVAIGNRGQATLTILDCPLINGNLVFSATNYSVSETGGVATITVQRLFGSSGAISVAYATTTNGTAEAGINYLPATGTLSWANADTAPKSFTVTVVSNSLVQGDVTLGLAIANPTGGATLGLRTNSTLTVRDASVGPGFFTFSSPVFRVSEIGTNAVITVLRTNGNLGVSSIDYSAAPLTAVAGLNFTPVVGTLVYSNGQTSASFLVPVFEQVGADLDKTVALSLFNPTNAAFGAYSNAVLVIAENQSVAGSLNFTFNPDINGPVDQILVQTNVENRIVIAGAFTAVNGIARPGLARLTVNGALDYVFDPGAAGNAPVRALAESQSDQRLYVAGAFTSFNLEPHNYVVRLMMDGSVDASFAARPDNVVNAVAVQADGRILIGGLFTSVAGQPRGYIARLLTNGAPDLTFLAGRSGADGEVRAIAIQPDGKILIAGDFNYVNGLARHKVARLLPDGSIDTAFNPGAGPDASVRVLIERGGLVMIGGLFESVAGISRSHIARLLADGALDVDFNPGAAADEYVNAIAFQQDDKLLVGGAFGTFNGYRRNRLTRLNSDGSVDTTFNIGVGADNYVSAVAVQPDQRILVGGGFATFNGQPPRYLVRLNGGFNRGPGSFGFAVANFAVNENASNALVTVVRSIGTAGEVSVHYSTADDTAVAGSDYQPVSGTLRFADGETVQTFIVPVMDNWLPTRDRTIALALTDPAGGAELGLLASATLTIVEDDGIVGFDQVNFSVNEGATNAIVTVTRTAGSVGYASVDYAMADSSANNITDYLASSGTLVFTNGQTNAVILIPILDDALIEGDETVNLVLSNPTNTMIQRSNATLTIVDNDFGPGTLGFSAASYSVGESGGSVNITVRRTGGSLGPVSVAYSVAPGSATAGADFVPAQNVLQFADGQASKTFTVQILDDGISEGNETVLLSLSNPQGGAVLNPLAQEAVLTIADDDVQPGAFRFVATNFVVVENSLLPAAVTIVRTNGSTGDVMVDFATYSGTALSDVDFVGGMTNTLTFTNGEVTKVVYITIIDDFAVEPTETVNLRLFNPRNGAALAEPAAATLQILDNESTISFGSAAYPVNEDAGFAQILVLRSGGTGSVVSVNYASTGGSALPGSDYSPVSGSLTFNAGETIKTIFLPITDNAVTNANKTVNLNLSGALGGAMVGSPSNTVVTIVDNDSLLALDQASYSVSEGAGEIVLTVLRAGSIGVPASVNISVAGGSATPGIHYVGITNQTLLFAANQSQVTVRVPIKDNAVRDGNHTVNVALSLPSRGAIITQGAAVITILDDDNSIIVPTASLLLAENLVANQSIDPGETVTIRFALRNVGNVTASNLVATLLATNGLTSPSAAQTYGLLPAKGASVSRAFSFTASAANGSTITAVLKLQDGANDLGTVSVPLLVGRLASSFANTNAIRILDDGAGSPYPSTINVLGLSGSISKISVTLSNVSHDFPRDIGVLLVGPAGQKMVLMSYAIGGWGYGLTNVTLTLDDAATNALPYENLVLGGTFRPTNYFNVPFPSPAPSAPTAPAGLSVFNGTDPNGAWSLYVMDQNSGDVGMIAGGWSMAISTAQLFPSQADIAASVVSPASVLTGAEFTYSITVANGGPSDAQSVVATNLLPAGVQLVSASVSQGSVTTNAGSVTAQFGTLSNGASATLALVVKAANPGQLTNLVTVGSAVKEPAADNNSVRVVTSVNAATPPSLVGPGLSGGSFQLTVAGQAGTLYYIDASFDLKTWTRIHTNTLGGPVGSFADPTAGSNKMRFYRVVMP